jgi:ABC-type multidrug transport system ATPase subunit
LLFVVHCYLQSTFAPVEIHLESVGKKFGRSWIFRDFSYRFGSGMAYAILGANGSGKSTLLQVISGFQSPTTGTIYYQSGGKRIQPHNFFRNLSMAAPAMELPEEFTLEEVLRMHAKFRKPLIPIKQMIDEMELAKHTYKHIQDFSSGMRQRVKLALALFYESEIILLDEPASHLDKNSTDWYLRQAKKWSEGRCLIISSNDPEEYSICTEFVRVEEYKKVATV